MKKITWTTPAGSIPGLCNDMRKQPHILIAGATGSGKSVLINSFLHALTFKAPCETGLILIDPKRVELVDWSRTPHCMRYASEPAQIVAAIRDAVALMERRYAEMQRQRVKLYPGADVWIIIDEFADLMTTLKKEALPPLCRIAQLGRAAKIHLCVATQRPTRDIINGQIKVNIDARIALRCPTKQDSRNIINTGGAELLPRYGKGFYLTPDTMQPILTEIPYIAPQEIAARIDYWDRQIPKKRGLFRR